MAKFVQIIEYRTSKPEEVMRLSEGWAQATKGRTTAVGGLTCIDRQDGHYYTLVEFPSFEAAMENSNLPETKPFAEQIAELCDEPPSSTTSTWCSASPSARPSDAATSAAWWPTAGTCPATRAAP